MTGRVAGSRIFDDMEHFKAIGESAAEIDSGLGGVWGGDPALMNRTIV